MPRTFATVLSPSMLLLPIQIRHTNGSAPGGDVRITNLWPGGSARPPDTRRASVFALQDTVRVSGGRPSPPRPPVREPPGCHEQCVRLAPPTPITTYVTSRPARKLTVVTVDFSSSASIRADIRARTDPSFNPHLQPVPPDIVKAGGSQPHDSRQHADGSVLVHSRVQQ